MAALAAGGYYFYTQLRNVNKDDIWSLVPENAVLVYENTNTVKAWNDVQKKAIWQNLLTIPFYKDLKMDFESLDSIGGKSGQLDLLLRGNPLLMSMHVTGKDNFGFIFFLELPNLESNEIARKIIASIKENADNVLSKRVYKKFEINEIKNKKTGKVFAYIFHKNFFIGSFTTHLVEDAIRNVTGENVKTFQNQNASLYTVSKLDDDTGNLYVNNRRLLQLVSIFGEGKSNMMLKNFAGSSSLDMTITDEKVLLNGFSEIGDDNSKTFLGTLLGQKSHPLGMAQFIPTRTAYLYHLTFDDAVAWKEKLKDFWNEKVPKQLGKWKQLEADYKYNPEYFFRWVGHEIGMITLESIDPKKPEKLLIVHANDVNEALNQMNSLTEGMAERAGDSVYTEEYSGWPIRQLNIPNFPEKILGTSFSDFDQCFYTSIGDYMVFGNGIEVIKSLVNDVELENVWSKSVRQSMFFESTLKEANLSYFMNTSSAWKIFLSDLSPKWKKFVTKNTFQTKQFQQTAVQFNNVENKFFTSVVVDFNKNKRKQQTPKNYVLAQNTNTNAPITIRPYIVRNHKTNRKEVLVQDDENTLYLIDNKGKVIWKDSLASRIQDDIHQIDYYKNGKLQYYFITKHAIHIIDRTGKYVEGFPVEVSEDVILDKTSVVDYDKSKRYRFLVSDHFGNVYMYDKNGKNLEGWQPRKLPKRLAVAPFHIRIRKKDCIVAMQEDGTVNVMTRRGNMYKGFPFELKSITDNPIFVQAGTSFSTTKFTTVTNNGQLVQFNLLGSVTKRKQLFRPSKDAVYKMAIDALGRTFTILRQEENRVSILDYNGDVIFEKDYVSSGEMGIQYYNFGRGEEVFILTDKEQEFTYMYDAEGNLINGQPIESGFEIGLMYFEKQNKYYVYKNYKNTFSILAYEK